MIGTIVVKDHSRLGRNRLVVGQLLEEDFVRLDIRYIAIMDKIDTEKGYQRYCADAGFIQRMARKEHQR